jgi:hypothetical protein
MNLAVYDETAAYACPENHAENDMCVCGGTIHGFGKGKAIRVVFYAYWPSQSEFEIAVKGLIVQGGAV